MNKYDISVLPDSQGTVTFEVSGKSRDSGLLLLQRLYVLMFSDLTKEYRDSDIGYDLSTFLEGSNIPTDEVLTSMLSITCAAARKALDTEDQSIISTFTAQSINSEIVCTLTLTDGTTITGAI